jgi:hypothetical protein
MQRIPWCGARLWIAVRTAHEGVTRIECEPSHLPHKLCVAAAGSPGDELREKLSSMFANKDRLIRGAAGNDLAGAAVKRAIALCHLDAHACTRTSPIPTIVPRWSPVPFGIEGSGPAGRLSIANEAGLKVMCLTLQN